MPFRATSFFGSSLSLGRLARTLVATALVLPACLARPTAGPNGDVAAAGDLHFLAWYPDVAKNQDLTRHPKPPVPALGQVDQLESAFHDLVVGVGQNGCGLEAQLESFYHFLVQPDPWTAIDKTESGATYGPKGDVDGDLLRQRAAFLRPDSLVAVVVLTDEDDSIADPLSFQGSGYAFMDDAPRDHATSACADDPTSKACTSCAFAGKGADGCTGEASTHLPLCEIPQVAVPAGEICRDTSTNIAFCYAEAPATTKCAYALAFTKASEKLTGARFTMQCIQQSASDAPTSN